MYKTVKLAKWLRGLRRRRKRDQITTASAFLLGGREQPSSLRSRRNTVVVSCSECGLCVCARRTKSEYNSDSPHRAASRNQFRSWQMVLASSSEPLSQLEVLVVDCQATAAAPRGHLLEIGWARVLGTTITHAHSSLIALPDGQQIPPAVARITGISEYMMPSVVTAAGAGRA